MEQAYFIEGNLKKRRGKILRVVYIMKAKFEKSESHFFTKKQNSQVLAVLQQCINPFGSMTQHNDRDCHIQLVWQI